SWIFGVGYVAEPGLIFLKMTKDKKDNVPLFKSWTSWYVLVIFFLIVLIILFYLFTKNYS
ncbi:MAG TPA: hypothetical protein VGO09_08895, partial [Flavisolibacter sp.]|nr:hypothetical protein [Flavisolibacter sp.]